MSATPSISPAAARTKRAVVTGATGGIGLWTAIGLVRAGLEVTITGRSAERLKQAASVVAQHANGIQPQTEQADFAALREVQALGDRLAERLRPLDLLVNNAGLISPSRRASADGYELTFAVNHLAPFLLTRVLLSRLNAAPSARVVTVASAAHMRGRMEWNDLMLTRGYSPMRAYAQSKLANILFTKELSRRLAGTSATANCVHPGVVGTGFGNVGGMFGLGWSLVKPFLLSPERGADTSIYLATAPELDGVSGAYFARRRAVTPSAQAQDAGAATRLWRESEVLVDRALGI